MSTALVRLRSRLAATKQHLQVVDDALTNALIGTWQVDTCAPNQGLINHAKARNAELGIRLLYTHFTEYLRSILREMYDQRPLEVVSKADASLRFHEIVQFGSYEALCDYMVEYVFRSLESQRSTQRLLEKILEKTGVKVHPKLLGDAMMYIEMRHLLVHNSGIVDQKFADVFGPRLKLSPGWKLNMSLGIARKGVEAVERLCVEIDAGLVEAGYLRSES